MTDRTKAWLRPTLLLGGLLAAGLLLRLLPAGGVSGLLAHESGEHGVRDAADLVLIGAALCAVGVPRQAIAYACGLAFGTLAGSGLAMVAQLLGCVANLVWARLVARDWAARRLRGRLAALDHGIAARPFVTTVSLRLLPVGSNVLLNLAAGVSSVAAVPFLAASALGFLPQTLVFTLAGAGAQIGHGRQLLLAAVLFVVSAGLGLWLLRRGRGTAISAGAARAATRPG